MKLTKEAIKKISRKPNPLKLAIALDFSEQWINRIIDANKNNGPLTTHTALEVIREVTGLEDSQILEGTVKNGTVKIH